MGYEFQQPGFVHAQDWSGISKSIDNLFNAYAEGKAQKQRLQLGQTQLAAAQQAQQEGLAQFQLNNGGLTPQRVNELLPQAMQPQGTTLPPGMMATPQSDAQQAAPSMYAQAPQGQGPLVAQEQPIWAGAGQAQQGLGQPQPSPESPDLTTVRHILAMHQQGQQIGAAQQVAGLQKTQAEAAKSQSDADINSLFSGKGGAGNLADWAAQLRSDVAGGKKAPSQAQEEASSLGPMGMGRMLVDGALKGLNTADLEAAYQGKKSLATGGAIPLANTKSLLSALDVLESMNKDTPRNSLQLINSIGLQAAAQKGDRHAQRLLSQSGLVSDMFQSNFGGGSDKKLALAESISNPAQTTDQLGDSINMMRTDLGNRKASLSGQQGTAHPDFSDKKSASPAIPQGQHEVALKDAKGNTRQAIFNGPRFVRFK